LRYARDFTNKRRLGNRESAMSRLYVVESAPTITGSMADHRWPLGPRAVQAFAHAVARGLGVANIGGSQPGSGIDESAVNAIVRDLQSHRGRGVVVAGDHQPAELHALAHAINQALGNSGATVLYTEPVEAQPVDHSQSIRELVDAMQAGAVPVLIILGGNPVYTAPADLKFADLLARAKFTVHLSPYDNETSALCRWRVPEAHYLEAWSDVRAFDGTATIIQPLIAPLYGGRTAHEFLAALMGERERTSYDLVRAFWQQQSKARGDFEQFWRAALHDGVVPDSAARPRQAALKQSGGTRAAAQTKEAPRASSETPPASGGLEVLFRPDPSILDGRFANNGWLQELPKPFTKITWDNVILVSPSTGERLGLSRRVAGTGGEHGNVYTDLVELEISGRRVRGPAWILPGHADDCVTVHLGYGRVRAGRVGTRLGFNANTIRTADAPWQAGAATLRKTGAEYAVACTQFHQVMEGRDLIRAGTLEQYRSDPGFLHAKEKNGHEASLYPGFKYEGNAWGMAIDLNSCIGCNACVVACVAENNIPVVGKKEVMRGREMHWLRIDRYYKGPRDNPEIYQQPVPCMQCENAPCELVCPVHATAHSEDGLNDMTYNRCVGTRYCSNNCPYKVRRFNFFQYQDFTTPSLKLMRNPDVTVRSRGVMEKCTYCVQRIRQAQIDARKENRPIADGEIATACEQACPAQAIVFGDINDPNSRVTNRKGSTLNYGLLTELNTRPRTTYLARLKNPNPELAKE
jgi:molybdopterin-containing oxidoreductase family iron-sulfur binding subunit